MPGYLNEKTQPYIALQSMSKRPTGAACFLTLLADLQLKRKLLEYLSDLELEALLALFSNDA